MGRGKNDTSGSKAVRRYHQPMSPDTLNQLRVSLARVKAGRPEQGVYIHGETREIINNAVQAINNEAAALELGAYQCSKATTAEEIASLIASLPGTPEVEVDATHPQGFRFPNHPSCLVLHGADLLPNKTWSFILQIMKRCNQREFPLLVVATGRDDNRLLARLYGIDGDSSMMWRSQEI